MRKLFIATGIVFLLISLTVKAQDYETSLGLRLDIDNFGLTFKHYLEEKSAVEGIAHFCNDAIILTGLYEYHGVLLKDEKYLKGYVGGGCHLGVVDGGKDKNNQARIGIDGIVGIEYTFKSFPMNFSIDLHPLFHLIEKYEPDIGLGISARYIFKY